MGYALAEAAIRRGAIVTLVSGPTSLVAPAGAALQQIHSAAEMYERVMTALPQHQIVIKAAAVADFTPVEVADRKIKKGDREELTLTLKKTPDILAAIGAASPKPFLVAFAAETDAVESNARTKMMKKNADLIVANDVADNSIGFDADQNEVLVLGRDGSTTRIAKAPKLVIANRILDLILARLA
jgi:phosphopantothenoylcysteine decarboxylase/phosphopantothenate--cysteine ligase